MLKDVQLHSLSDDAQQCSVCCEMFVTHDDPPEDRESECFACRETMTPGERQAWHVICNTVGPQCVKDVLVTGCALLAFYKCNNKKEIHEKAGRMKHEASDWDDWDLDIVRGYVKKCLANQHALAS